jgi:large subunit ribosomal protein L6
MSRIGRLPVVVPAGVDVAIDGQTVTVKGPKGQLALVVAEPIAVAKGESGAVEVTRPDDERLSRSLHGLTRTLIANMVIGVTEGYEKTLEIVGTGYRVQAKGANLEFALGYSHPITVEPPAGISFVVEAPTRSRSRASTSSRSARSPPTSASCASPTRTRPRAFDTPASRSAARSERPGRSKPWQ